MRYLLDTNHLARAIDRVSPLRDRINQAHRAGHKVGTCVPALCELEVGIQQTARADALRRNLSRLLQTVRIWPVGRDVARHYGEAYLDLRRRGKALSQVDILLAALARLMNLTLLTADRDFEAVSDLRTENWLGGPVS